MGHSQTTDRRHFVRIPLERQAYLEADGTRHPCELADVSLKGALVVPQTDWRGSEGTKVELDIMLNDMDDAIIHMRGEIAHVQGDQMGIACHQLDLESATLLRRVVELNLADPDLLERELQAMVETD
jgi:hypothetical protein